MLSTDELVSYATASIDTDATQDLQQRLSLYRVFSKLYEQHRSLLDEILQLENSGSKVLSRVALPYVQGIVLNQKAYLMTNLVNGKTQSLMQPQQIWTIGRDLRKVGIAIQDGRLSRCHAAIKYVEGKGFYLVDLGSSNGSFRNGERVWRSAALKDGDRIRLGSLVFVFLTCQGSEVLPLIPTEGLPQNVLQALLSAGSEVHPAQSQPAQPSESGQAPLPHPLQETFSFQYGSELKR
jgi:pSer/pThr/pTyr-binding forkhead associated (FHA) protein